MKKLFITCALALLAGLSSLSAQTRLIAHRGFWDREGSAQNSIASLVASHEVQAYGSELDVIITALLPLMVFRLSIMMMRFKGCGSKMFLMNR